MDILSEIKSYSRLPGPRCTIAQAAMSAKEREQFELALAAPAISSSAIAKWLTSKGFGISKAIIARHRRGDCLCSKVAQK